MSFTDQKPRVVTEKEYNGRWGGYTDRRRFRCYMCGRYFQIGDTFRWVCPGNRGVGNLMVCEECDGPDIVDRWVARVKELKTKFWWANRY